MDLKKSKKLLAVLAACYWALAVLIYLVAGQQFHYTTATSDALSAGATIGELVDGMTVTQRVIAPAERITGVELMTATYGRVSTGKLHASLVNGTGEVVALRDIDAASLPDGRYITIPLEAAVQVQAGEPLTLTLTTMGCAPGNAVTVYCGNTIVTGRFDIAQSVSEADRYTVNGAPGLGRLCVRINGVKALTFYRDYWLIVGGAFATLALLCLCWWRQARAGRKNPLATVCTLVTRYGFLIRQLVSRDFKAKYKRSVLGMAWSFLNPLLTMSVQYVVFSTLFKSDMPNYPVYLLSGIVFFSFFNEAISMGMTAITGNASLIKKVYMPKYIYPLSRLISSLINLGLALIPLLLVTLLTGIWLRPSMLLLVFDILCLLGFVFGMMLLLSTSMTFFQDTQFLWGVISMMWMYFTPIFYPESIIPQQFLTLYHINPMYQYITFARICIIDGGSPEPMAYLWCLISSLAVLLLGLFVFKKNQDKFALYL